MVTLILRAKPAEEKDGYIHTSQEFEEWDEQEGKWKLCDFTSNKLYEERNPEEGKRGMDLFEKWLKGGKYDEIQLQPLLFDDFGETVKEVEELMDKKANGLALMRRFWRGGLSWVPYKETRLTWAWKYDDTAQGKKMCTTFDKGEWKNSGSDPPKFVKEGKQTDLEGLNLSGLKLVRGGGDDSSLFPRKFSYTGCAYAELDGSRKATSFRGAYLFKTRFCGKSRLTENDLTSTMCYETHFDFPNVDVRQTNIDKGTSNLFKGICLDEASFIDTAKFTFKDSDFGTHHHPDAGKFEYTNSTFNYLLLRSRKTLSKHKSELAYLVDELERLRKYEANKDNWQEIIDSWTMLRKMSFFTKEAFKVQEYLFEQEGSKDLIKIGNVLYSMDDEPPYGLLRQIKLHVQKTILGNEKYPEKKRKLQDEIENINAIILWKDRTERVTQNFVLGFFIFFFTIGANIVSEKVETWMLSKLD